jgi:hypothetical protein
METIQMIIGWAVVPAFAVALWVAVRECVGLFKDMEKFKD